jgi:hypothetical protein
MGSGFASIPQIGTDVPVSTTPPRQARVAPYVPAPGAEQLKQVGEGLGQLGNVLAVQYEHRQILDGEIVTEGIRNKFAELRAQNAALPGDQQASTFQQQSNEIIKAAVNDPANSHIKGYLQSELPKTQGIYYRDALEAGAHQTMQEQYKQTGLLGKTTANTAGGDYQMLPASYARNEEFAKPGPYQTNLAPADEAKFQQWVGSNKVNFNPNDPNADYDMRGYWKDVASKGGNQTAINSTDGKLHFPDTYKTPFDASFSAESKYATPDNPFKWKGETLVDQRSGKSVYQTGQPGGEDQGKNMIFTDGPLAQAAEERYKSTVDALYGKNPAIVSDLMATYQQQKLEKRLQAVAEKDPTNIGSFIAALPPGAIDGNQIQAAYSHANEAMALPQRQLDAAHANLRANEVTYQQQYIAKNGQPDVQRANDASKFNKWEAGDYRSIMGRDYEMETPPAVKALYDKQVGDLKSVDEAEQLKNNLHAAGAFKEMNGGDVQQYLGKVDEQIKQIKTPAGQAKILAEEALKDYYRPANFRETFGEHRNALEGAYSNALANFRAAILSHPDDANAIWDDVRKMKTAYPRPTLAMPATAAPTPRPTPTPTPTPVDDATKAAFKAWFMTHHHPEALR